MMKKHFLKLMLALMLVALLVAPASAFNLANHTIVAPNAKGDMLVYPAYLATDGLDTNIAVINTSDTLSCVVKVVVRSHKYSQELLDFLIYLSPNDEFKCTLSFDGSDYVMTTTDDSLCVASGMNPTVYKLATPCDGVVDTAAYGYVEMIEATTFALAKGADGTVAKQDIIDAYALLGAAGPFDPANILTGFAEMVFPGADYAAYQATVFENYINTAKLNMTDETLLGNQANNNLCEIEAALAKNNLAIPYYAGADGVTLPLFTFPTKESQDCKGLIALGPFFQGTNYDPLYTLKYYDMEENTPTSTECPHSPCPPLVPDTLDEEVNLLIADSPYAEGWARANFGQATSCTDISNAALTYTGAPVIAKAIELTSNGISILPVAFDYGTVTYNGLNVTRQYQTGAAATEVAPPNPEPTVDCTTLDQASCTGDCVWSAFPNPGCMLNCAQFTDQASCEAGLNAGCQWNSTAFGDVCAPK